MAKALGAKVTIITVTEQRHIYAGPAGGVGWIPAPDEMVEYKAGRKAAADRVLAEAKTAADRLVSRLRHLIYRTRDRQKPFSRLQRIAAAA